MGAEFWVKLSLVILTTFSFGFQLGHLVTSFQYETNDRYSNSRQREEEIDKIESVD